MMLLNIEYIPGKRIEALGLVKGTTVYSKSFGKDFMAGMKTLVGGEIEGYTDLLRQARQIATKRMVDEAEEVGADAVVNVRYASASIYAGGGGDHHPTGPPYASWMEGRQNETLVAVAVGASHAGCVSGWMVSLAR